MSKLGSLYIRLCEPEGELYGKTCEIDDWAADEIERLRAELAESATDLSHVLETVKYLAGIAERGEGRKIEESEPVEQFVLGYVKKLEAEIEHLRDELAAMRNQEPVAWVHESGDIRFILSPDEITTEQIALNSWKPLIYAELAAGAQPAPSVPEVTDAAQDLLAACKEFVRKVEAGEARSVRSYAQMKAAIAKAENAQPEPDANCITLPDGSCVGGLMAGKQPCMHDRPSGAQPAPSVPDSGRLTPFNSLNAASNAAPEAPKRKPLTREEMDAATRDAADKLLDCIYEHGTASEAVGPAVRAIGRAVEAAHGIKENSND